MDHVDGPMGRTGTPYPAPPTVPIAACPIHTSLGTLGRKWALEVLRDVAFFPRASFGTIRRHNPGLLQRTLSLRLAQLMREDLVRRVVPAEDTRHPYYEPTEKGLEVWPILSALFQFGIKHHAAKVFADGRPRELAEVYPNDAALLLGPLAAYARTAGGPSPGTVGVRALSATSERAAR